VTVISVQKLRLVNAGQLVLLRRLLNQKRALISFIVILAFVAMALGAQYIAPASPFAMRSSAFLAPGPNNLMGTDRYGRDVFSRVLYGARVALLVALGSALVSALVGIFVGAISGYYAGWVDDVLARVFDMFIVIPTFFLVILIVAIFGSSIYFVTIVIGITAWPANARLMRAQVLSLKSRMFVQASIGGGSGTFTILFRHIVPNGVSPIITNTVLTEAGLSFLGLGDTNVVSWGHMINEGQATLTFAPWVAIFPGLAMLALVAAFNFLSDALGEALNPRSQ
jgi:peptide/nickel transport system permease protein